MKVISTIVDYKGNPVKIENGKVYARAFGTTINNHSMHYSWLEITNNLNADLKKELKQQQLI